MKVSSQKLWTVPPHWAKLSNSLMENVHQNPPERVCIDSEERRNWHCPQFRAMLHSRDFINSLTHETWASDFNLLLLSIPWMAPGRSRRQYNATAKKKTNKEGEGTVSAVLADSALYSQNGFFNLSWKARIFIWICKKHISPGWNTDRNPQKALKKHCRSRHCYIPLAKLLPGNPRVKVYRIWSFCYHTGQQKKMKARVSNMN